MNKDRIRRYVNIFIAAGSIGSWLSMFLIGGGELASSGWATMKYFTVLSNLFAGITAVIWLFRTVKGNKASERLERVKYVAAVSVMLTFTVVMVFLGPLYGYIEMVKSANLFFHVLVPLVCLAEIIFLQDANITKSDNLIAVIPPLMYGIAYLTNILINGRGEWPDTNDWYWFFAWGYAVGVVIYVVIIIVTWLLGLMMRKLQKNITEPINIF